MKMASLLFSLWYLYDNGKLYCATQASARVVGYLRECPHCAFEIAADEPPYCGVRGQGVATIDPQRGVEVLGKLLERYVGDIENTFARRLLTRETPEVAIIIKPTRISTWNFRQRMSSAMSMEQEKPCP